MPGGLLQLSAFGTASTYLHADPQITFWKQVWRRSTAYAMESIEMPFQGGQADFGRKATAAITKSADMAYRAWLEVTLPDLRDYYTASVSDATTTTPSIQRAYYTSRTLDTSVTPNVYKYTAVARVALPTSGSWTKVRLYQDGTLTPLTEATFGLGTKTVDVTLEDITANPLTLYAVALTESNELSSQSARRDVLCLAWCNAVGLALLDSAEWEIGGTRIDKIPNSEFMDAWAELTMKEEKRAGFNAMVGKFEDFDIWNQAKSIRGEQTFYVPLLFSFTASPGQSMPIVSLQFHEARLNLTFRDALECINANVPINQLVSSTGKPVAFKDCRLFVDMVYLDTEERRRMSSMPHEALITQVQFLGDVVLTGDDRGGVRKISLDGLNHPIKELIWVYQPYSAIQRNAVTGNDWFNYGTADSFQLVRLTLNGSERMTPRPGQYFRQVQPYQHHTRVPTKQVLCYNFGLEPESPNPTGSCNFSRLDAASLQVTMSPSIDLNGGKIKLWALGYNVVRYKEGLAGLAFTSG